MTKCGRYGLDAADFDYSPETIRRSVMRSMERLKTNYLDVVYLHDAEFIASTIRPVHSAGDSSFALTTPGEKAWGLTPGEEGRIWGEGDQKVLTALAELRKMKEEGLINGIGITGEETVLGIRHPTDTRSHSSHIYRVSITRLV